MVLHDDPANRDAHAFGEEVKYQAKKNYNYTFGRLEQVWIEIKPFNLHFNVMTCLLFRLI